MISLDTRIAHRGITAKNAPENSLAALKNAVEARVPIELDIHLTRDNRVVVFHDYTLFRMCKKFGVVELSKYSSLQKCKLSSTAENIPLLSEVLAAVRGRVPIFIELKTLLNGKKLCNYLTELLDEYKGQVAVFGFDSRAVRYIKKKRNYTVLVSCFRPKKSFNGFVPDGICCNINALKKDNLPPDLPAIVSWTITTEQQRAVAERFGGYLENISIEK